MIRKFLGWASFKVLPRDIQGAMYLRAELRQRGVPTAEPFSYYRRLAAATLNGWKEQTGVDLKDVVYETLALDAVARVIEFEHYEREGKPAKFCTIADNDLHM